MINVRLCVNLFCIDEVLGQVSVVSTAGLTTGQTLNFSSPIKCRRDTTSPATVSSPLEVTAKQSHSESYLKYILWSLLKKMVILLSENLAKLGTHLAPWHKLVGLANNKVG